MPAAQQQISLFVGNLAYFTSEAALRAHFDACAPVRHCQLIVDHDTGDSKGYAFVTMGTLAGTEQAIRDLDGSELDGRAIRVSQSRGRR